MMKTPQTASGDCRKTEMTGGYLRGARANSGKARKHSNSRLVGYPKTKETGGHTLKLDKRWTFALRRDVVFAKFVVITLKSEMSTASQSPLWDLSSQLVLVSHMKPHISQYASEKDIRSG